MRPFGCLVTILNTLDPLGKFQRKVDEGFLVGYSVCSKAFRVFNSRTRIIQETLHVNFLENKPNVAGTGPTLLFDINSLTRTMNYQPVTIGNQTNFGAGFQDKFDAEKAGEEVDQTYVLFPVWFVGSTNPQNNNKDVAFDGKEHDFDATKPESVFILSLSSKFEDCSDNSSIEVNAASSIVPTVKQNTLNNTNTFSVAGPSKLEDITYSDDEDVVGAEADFNNLESSIPVSPIPTTRIHKDHPVSQIIGDLSLPTQIRSMTRAVKDQVNTAFYVQNRVLVTKPHNKTPCELLHGRTPSIGLMRPFGCPVTILNTLDPLGKFQGKVDEGFLVGYSVYSKAFRVFNSRTRIIQETLHVNFLENKPNVIGTGPTWLFDIDSLTRTMNYQPVHARNQTNSGAEDVAFDGKEHDFDVKKPESKFILSPSSSAQSKEQDDKTKKEAKGKSHVESVAGYIDLNAEFEDCSENSSNEVNAASSTVPTVGQNSLNSTNTFSAVGPSNDAVSPTYGKISDIDAS
nr:retrovirus-related Pol polyprotein from transposon TNT 1-94 [Tanacetum cinerariifolium]